ncbi:oligosaccharide flippase family protein [Candidatus Dojkabacteria bacterium]|jgi:putative peptidoglycan lipid II flippase|nr:oligosaccharide flippase family protein [Candidatus Dojkabacteria bacterium]
MIILVISKVLGFLKMTLIAQLFGTSRELDIFWAAFTIPDTIFNILVAGAINSAIIPIFATVLHKEGEEEMNLLYKRLNIIFLVSFMILSIIVFIFAPNIGQALINSKSLNTYLGTTSTIQAQDINLFVTLMRVMLLSPLLLGMSSLITSYLQVRKKFLVTALAPLFYNLAMIVISLIAVKVFHFGITGVAISVVAGSVLHFAVQVPALVAFIKHPTGDGKLVTNIKTYLNKEVFAVLKLAFPRMLGLLGEQVNTFINTIISFTLSAGSLSAFKFAYSLHLFPIQIFTGAVSQVALSNFSEYSAKGETEKFEESFNKAIKQTLFLILPVIAVLLVLRLPIVRLVYGLDSWWGTVITSWCLSLLTLSIFAQSVSVIVYRAFYAVHETKLPLIATAVAIAVNLAASFYMTNFFSHYLDWRPILNQVVTQVSHFNNTGLWDVIKSFIEDTFIWMTTRNNSDAAVGGLAFATSISWFAEMLVALFLINKRVKIVTFVKTIKPLLPLFLNTFIMIFGMYFVFKLSDFSLDTSRTIYVIIVTGLTLLYGAISFSLGCKLFKITEFDLMIKRGWEYIRPFYIKYFKKR